MMETIVIKRVKYTLFIAMLLTAVLVLSIHSAKAQVNKETPVREYVNPAEMVSLSKNMKFNEAIEVLNEYAQRYAGKFIVDRTNTKAEIGIPINKIQWKDALQYIVDVQGLQIVETPRFFEVKVPETQQKPGEPVMTKQDEEKPLNFRSREIRIKAIFFEGNKRALREIGVDWSTIHNIGIRPEGLTQVIDPSSTGGGSGGSGGSGGVRQTLPDLSFGNEYVEVNSKAAQQVTQNLFNGVVNLGEIGNSGIEVRALFKAFEANNLGKILATPEIKVLDGQEGRIQVGQDFSIKQRDFSGNVTDRFFSVGTILKVTPNIIHDGDSTFVDMDISAERSTAQPDPVSTIVNKQQATSEILLLDGEATVIAGLYRTENNAVRKGIPILKDLPPWFFGLRYLFGYNSDERVEQELVILIKASIEPQLRDRMGRRLKSTQELLQEKRQQQQDSKENYKDIMKEK